MDINLYLTFLLLSFLMIIIPGPNILVIVSASLDSGYAIFSVKLKPVMEKHNLYKIQNVFTGLLLLGVSAWLAVSRRVQ